MNTAVDNLQSSKNMKRFIMEYWKKHYSMPSVREIVSGGVVKSTSHVHYILERLEKEGWLYKRETETKFSARAYVPISIVKILEKELVL